MRHLIAIVATVSWLIIGTMFMHYFDDKSFIDSVYWAVVTCTVREKLSSKIFLSLHLTTYLLYGIAHMAI